MPPSLPAMLPMFPLRGADKKGANTPAIAGLGRENALTPRILYVEDDPAAREVALFNLRKAGYDVTPSSDGQEAVSHFSPEKFDLIVTDVRMPGMSGIELVRRIRAMASNMPCIVVTAYGDMATAIDAMKEGACYFIAKPFDRDQLLLAVGKSLDPEPLADELRGLDIPSGEVEKGIVCVFPECVGSLRIRKHGA